MLQLAERIRGYRTNLAFRFMPKIANLAVWAASAKAMPRLRPIAPIRLLLDSTIHAHAITHDDAWVDTGEVLWGGVQPIRTGYAARVPIHSVSNKTRQYQDICHLTVITALARKNIFSLYTSAELMAERTRHPPNRFQTVGYSSLSQLDGLQIESVDGWHFDSFMTGGASISALSDAQRARLKASNDPLYETILRILGNEVHSQDAWHIRTAQVHNMHALLTMDYSLIRLTLSQKRRLLESGVTVQILTPMQLAQTFGLRGVPPHLFSYTNASFPVRSDLCMPGERRGRSSPQRRN